MTKKKPISKAQFVRSMGNKPAKDVIAAAKAKGIKLTAAYVYVIRSKAGKKPAAAKAAPKKNGHVGDDRHQKFADLVLSIGFDAADQLVREMRAKALAAIS